MSAPEEAHEPLVTPEIKDAARDSFRKHLLGNVYDTWGAEIEDTVEVVAPLIAARAEAALRKRLADEIAAIPCLNYHYRIVRDAVLAIVNPPPKPPKDRER